MLASKILIDYTNLLLPYDFEKNDNIILSHFKNECNSIEVTNMYPNLRDQTKLGLNETNKANSVQKFKKEK